MHLIFIRHGDPDYINNTVTVKGKRESELLSERVSKWNVTEFFCSPYGRAIDTITPALDKMNRKQTILPWLKEFDTMVWDKKRGQKKLCWDFSEI